MYEDFIYIYIYIYIYITIAVKCSETMKTTPAFLSFKDPFKFLTLKWVNKNDKTMLDFGSTGTAYDI